MTGSPQRDDVRRTYKEPVSRLLEYGECEMGGTKATLAWPDYVNELGLTQDHVPELIRLASDEMLNTADSESLAVWAPTHAWRALGQLRAPEAVAPLLDLLKVKDDDWLAAELPAVLGLIGPGAIPWLAEFLADPSNASQFLMTAVRSLAEIGTRNSTLRDECIAVLVHQLERGDANDPTINGFVISSLLDLEAVEAIDEIRQAFQKQAVDLSIAGDVEDVEMELGLRTGRSTPRPLYPWFMEDTMPRLADGDPGATPDRNVGASSMQRKVGRNDPCPCGSGKKYKKCCLH